MRFNVSLDKVQLFENNSIYTVPDYYKTGQFVSYNDSTGRNFKELHFVINGKGSQKSMYRNVLITGERCIGPCLMTTVASVAISKNYIYWSDATKWPNGTLPKEGDDVVIKPEWNMVFDLAESPVLRYLEINGRLSFKNDTDLHLRAKHILVRAGELIVGYKDAPFTKNAKITLYGNAMEKTLVYDNSI